MKAFILEKFLVSRSCVLVSRTFLKVLFEQLPTHYPQFFALKKRVSKNPLKMERETRLELATSSLARKHSTTELLPRIYYYIC